MIIVNQNNTVHNTACIKCSSWYMHIYLTSTQKAVPEKEVMATGMVASIIFPWQVERILSIKFPEETSRAEQAGYVSFICLL